MVGPRIAFFALGLALATFGCAESETRSVGTISQQAFLSAPPDGALILDVRSAGEFEAGHIPGAVNIPHDELADRLAEIEAEPDRPVVVYCQSGRRAGMATSLLSERGFSQVLHLDGDMAQWRANGLAIE
jgi:phage shock protein E